MKRNDFLVKIIRAVGYLWLQAVYRIRIRGQENLPRQGPGILVAKHQFWTDIPLVGLTAWKRVNYIAKQELFTYWGIRHFLIGLGGIPLDRGKPVKTLGSFRLLERLLAEKEWIVIFPEGTYYPNSMGPGKHRLIQRILRIQGKVGAESGVPFIPIGIRYGAQRFRPEVEVEVGPALFAAGEEDAERFTHRIIEEIARFSKITLKEGEI